MSYTVVLVSDAHAEYTSSGKSQMWQRFESFLRYYSAGDQAFIASCGDVANSAAFTGGQAHPERGVANLINGSAASPANSYSYTLGTVPGKSFYWVTGNHENISASASTDGTFASVMGHGTESFCPSYYFDYSGDRYVFIHFRNMSRGREQFFPEDVELLHDALSTAGGKRVFVFEHAPDDPGIGEWDMCGKSTKSDAGHWLYQADPITVTIAGTTSTGDARELFRREIKAFAGQHPGQLLWLHGHTHKLITIGDNWDDTYFDGDGYTAHIPSLGRPHDTDDLDGDGYTADDASFGEWAEMIVSDAKVTIDYYRLMPSVDDPDALDFTRRQIITSITIPVKADGAEDPEEPDDPPITGGIRVQTWLGVKRTVYRVKLWDGTIKVVGTEEPGVDGYILLDADGNQLIDADGYRLTVAG